MPLAKIIEVEKKTFYSQMFPLSAQYPLVDFQAFVASQVIYALIVYWGLSRKKSDSKPLISDGRWILRVYNTLQVILSGYISYYAFATYMKKLINEGLVCQPMRVSIDSNRDEYELETYTCWLFYMSKWVDYLDTLFIISRSKWRQLSFLHMFHHSSIIALSWLATHYHPCGYFLIAVQLNAPVHFVMYFYYLCSSFPSLSPFLWWKNYITTIQLIQFITGTIATTYCFFRQLLGYQKGVSLLFTLIFICYGITLFSLFRNFYVNTYKKKKVEGKQQTVTTGSKKSKKDL